MDYRQEETITVELNHEQARLALIGLALLSEVKQFRHSFHLPIAAEKIQKLAAEKWRFGNGKISGFDDLFARMKYPIKSVTVKEYDVNPKKKPEEQKL